jgi:N-acetylglucosaminyldiphosphoundecaprenol N-acetyl-beta-D-mannosaminyltransferase
MSVSQQPAEPGRVTLHGLPIDPLTEQQALDALFASLNDGRGGVVLTPNLDHLQRYAKEPGVREAYARADLVLADGMPLVWASRLQGTPLPARVPGSDLVWAVSKRAARERSSVYLLGGAPGVASLAQTRLNETVAGLKIAGTHCPGYGFLERPDEVETMLAEVVDAAPDVVFVGLPSPTAEEAIELLRAKLPGAWFLGVGVSLSFIAGDVRRAPPWMRRTGLEWIWRLIQEPRRLARRYLLDGLPFAARLAVSATAERLR